MTPNATTRTALVLASLLSGAAQAQDDVEIEVEASEPRKLPREETPIAPPPPNQEAELEATVRLLEARLAALEARPAVEPTPPDPPTAAPDPAAQPDARSLKVTGYIQAQYRQSQLSEDEVSVDGEPLNKDRFLIRRGRIALSAANRFTLATLEVDINTVGGPFVSPSQADVVLRLPHADADKLSLLTLAAGLSDIPFGAELPQGSRSRLFMERTQGSRALFPGEQDIGLLAGANLGPLRVAAAAQNGVPISNTPTDALVFTGRKTFLGRVGAEASLPEVLKVAGGLSYLSGGGLHEGSPESKSGLSWSDKNQNGLVSLDELVGVNSQGASPSIAFDRWAIAADLQFELKTPLGWSRVFAEATMASNLDRGYLEADPISTGYDIREVGWNVGLVQDVLEYGLIGVRADAYDPNSDAFASQRGEFVDADLSIFTLSPAAGLVIKDHGRLVVQYDYIVDLLARDVTGIPIDLPNDQWTVRAQMEF